MLSFAGNMSNDLLWMQVQMEADDEAAGQAGDADPPMDWQQWPLVCNLHALYIQLNDTLVCRKYLQYFLAKITNTAHLQVGLLFW